MKDTVFQEMEQDFEKTKVVLGEEGTTACGDFGEGRGLTAPVLEVFGG